MSVPFARNVQLHRFVAWLLPYVCAIAFYGCLIAIPCFHMFQSNVDVREHAYLQGFINDGIKYDGINFMLDVQKRLAKSCATPNSKEIAHSAGLEPFSHWYDTVQDDAPEVYKEIAKIAQESIPRLELGYNDFRYVFKNGFGVTGSSLVLRLKCGRCTARGASMFVATLDTGSKKSFTVDAAGNVRKAPESPNYTSHCTSSILGTSIALAAMKELATYYNQAQDVILLITDRQLPYAAGTRHFLDEYFGKPGFRWHSGWLRSGLALELGYGSCDLYELNYEGIDGVIPNQDAVGAFIAEATTQDLNLTVMGLWERIASMAGNSYPNLPHVPMLSRSIASFTITCAKRIRVGEASHPDKLLKTVLVNLRMHNNLENELERGDVVYQLVNTKSYVPMNVYILLVPFLLAGPTAELLYSCYTWDFHVLVISLGMFILNAFMGPWLSYKYLVGAVGNDLDSTSEENLGKIKIAFLLLFISGAGLLVLNVLLAYFIPVRVFSKFDEGRGVIVRKELLDELGYYSEDEDRLALIIGRFSGLMDRLQKRTEGVVKFLQRYAEGKPPDSKRKRLSEKLCTVLERARQRVTEPIFVQAEKVPVAEESKVIVKSRPSQPTDVTKKKKRGLFDSMYAAPVVYPTNTQLPMPNVIVSVGTLFFTTIFLYSLMLLNWPLSVVLALLVAPSLRRVKIWRNLRFRYWVDFAICGFYLCFLVVLSRNRNMLAGIRGEFVAKAYKGGRFDLKTFVTGPYNNLLVVLKHFQQAEIKKALKGPFVLRKVLGLVHQHVLLGSAALPLIWFCAFPVLFHVVLIFTLEKIFKLAA